MLMMLGDVREMDDVVPRKDSGYAGDNADALMGIGEIMQRSINDSAHLHGSIFPVHQLSILANRIGRLGIVWEDVGCVYGGVAFQWPRENGNVCVQFSAFALHML